MAHKNVDYKPEDIQFPNQKIVQSELVHEMQSSYIEYAMSVIVGRALPDVRDGLKPVHRRILYAMYEDGLTSDKAFKKSATCVGDVLGRYHPHGDASVYDALVRLAQDFSMRYMLVDGHGNFGSIDGDPPAAYRYTEARMSKIANEMLRDIDKETVDWDPNFDESRKEPRVLPARFPNLLVNGSSGIAVGMATNIPPHNLTEVINACVCVLDNPEATLYDLMQHVTGPDFPTKGIIMGRSGIRAAYATGRGKIILRARTEFEEFGRDRTRIIVTELPYQVNKRMLIKNMADQVNDKRLEGISDIRDETDLSGLRIAIDLKRGVDPDKLMAKLYRSTTLQDSFSCNFNVLVDGYPRVMGVRQILHEWVKWRIESTRRRINFDLGKKSERLHLLHGLEAILLDIDKAIAIIRGTKLEAEVVPNLMKGFDIDETQAEFVAELKLRNINEEYILNRTKDIAKLEGEIAELEEILSSEENIKKVISDELAAVNKKYVMPRRTGRIEPHEVIEVSLEPEVEEYPVTIMLSRDGYLKKMTDRVLKKATTLKYKDGDKPFIELPSSNTHELLVFTNKSQVYKCKVAAFEDTKSAQLGSYLPTDLEMEPDESVIWVIDPEDYKADVLFVFENGRVVRVALSGYVTKTNRKRLKNAIYGGSKLLYAQVLKEDRDIALVSSDYRLMNFNTSLLKTKTTTNTQGVQAFTAKKGRSVTTVGTTEEILGAGVSAEKFTAQSLPSAGALMKENDMPSLFD